MSMMQPVRLVLAAEHDGSVLYQYGYACVDAETETEDIAAWGRWDPIRSWVTRRRTVIEWESGWPVETMTYPGERDWARGELTPARGELP